MLLTLALIAGLWLAAYVYFRLRYRFADGIPTVPPQRFFFGNGLEFYRKNSYQIFKVLWRVTRDQERIFKLRFGPIQVLCPTHPDLIQRVLCESVSMEKPDQYKFLRVDTGLLSSECT
ncbi:cytochrome P450 [Culex quinquefasciatus]|uniref:Cytochrome P450 n=1 Tax=Culex quinquefasciatus TaxID=7176 RepID=B0WXQ4_CULQU|nr:cytochrome P450 [Culex quinquefasciatus]|eukprot:XP_001862176.1 cytochrome P450 [Culex quinquefasciatus]